MTHKPDNSSVLIETLLATYHYRKQSIINEKSLFR